ncbi:fumarylacetoacetate hydrolase family protein [Actinomycetospora sp. OC33-EN08]|uniref:Fumarylacetoacetate hydrolase family protein n=1 Tax=Actinomycetospora aurantiaca TaxID=3129233 RepID=A0ABU8MU21_9PSEU
MRIANLRGRLVLVVEDRALDVETASAGRFSADPQAVYERWQEFLDWASTADPGRAEPFEHRDLGAPVPRPSQVLAIGLNYRDHAAESGFALPDAPTVFTKFVSSFTGPYDDVVLAGPTVDWEVELVAVLGRTARRVPAERGWDYIAGLTAGQDLSERTVQGAGPAPQFSLGKSFPGFGPTGPWLVTPDEFADRDDIALGCAVNGESMQKGRTSDLVFTVPQLVAELSAVLELRPGDVIFTGTPAGVGAGRNPKRFLAAGDELVTTVEGIGTMRHRLVPA